MADSLILSIIMTEEEEEKMGEATEDQDQCALCESYHGPVPHTVSWIICEKCEKWYHFHCLGLSKDTASRILRYYCPNCRSIAPSCSIEYKRTSRRSKAKIDYVALNDGDLESTYISSKHPHISEFNKWENQNDSCGIEIISGDKLTVEYALKTKLPRPVKIPRDRKGGLGITVPMFSIDDLVEDLGDDHPIEVMDVLTQNGTIEKYNLSKWRDYFVNKPERDRILNVLSLEISHSDIGQRTQRPKYVEQVDLVDKVWPNDKTSTKPKVSKYCLMGVKDSYTDFHLDFAGTSVYYTILKGRKEFIFFPPTNLNYKKFVQWTLDPLLNKEFLGSMNMEHGVKVSLEEGDVLIIPCGWIHGVYTPEDTLVIGGNFLTSFNIKEQLRVIELEDLTKVQKKFRFPNFTKLMWLTCVAISNGNLKIGRDIDKENCDELYKYLKGIVTGDEKVFRESIVDVMTKRAANEFLEEFKSLINHPHIDDDKINMKVENLESYVKLIENYPRKRQAALQHEFNEKKPKI